MLGCWLTEPLNRVFARRGTIFISSLIAALASIWEGVVQSWPNLLVARFVLGLGIGAKSATVPVYAAECAPAPIRGALVMQWQVWTAFGIMVSFCKRRGRIDQNCPLIIVHLPFFFYQKIANTPSPARQHHGRRLRRPRTQPRLAIDPWINRSSTILRLRPSLLLPRITPLADPKRQAKESLPLFPTATKD